ncbi:MAG: 2-methylfumaryl-CoA hydratase, partial [uncultured Actinomycetospora sp.]
RGGLHLPPQGDGAQAPGVRGHGRRLRGRAAPPPRAPTGL